MYIILCNIIYFKFVCFYALNSHVSVFLNMFLCFYVIFQSDKVKCPMTGKTLKMKDLIDVKFTPIKDGDKSAVIVKQVRYRVGVWCRTKNNLNIIFEYSLNVVSYNG